jgi:hypothetical protein
MNLSADPADSQSDWEEWFVKFWAFMSARPEIKGFSYINANWPEHAYPTWGDARIQNSPLISSMYRKELKTPKYIHLPFASTSAVHDRSVIPLANVPHHHYPSPSLSGATIVYELQAPSRVRLELFDALGRRVRLLTDGMQAEGRHHVRWDGRDDSGLMLDAGLYLYRLHSGAGMTGGKILYIR